MFSRTHSHCNLNSSIGLIDTVFVPKGMEYQAVCRGMGKIKPSSPQIIPIPVGRQAVTDYLEQWQQTIDFCHQPPQGVMVMGLGGSLSPIYQVGNLLLYRDCGYTQEQQWHFCDNQLSELVFQHLGKQASWGRGLTSDRVICQAAEKRQLGQQYQADVVDMEGIAILNWCQLLSIPVVMLRVISDNCQQDLPDLTPAFDDNGVLQPLKLAQQMLKYPSNSIHLIRSSLQGLEILKQVAKQLFLR